MLSIIIFGILSIILGIITSNFLELAYEEQGKDFNLKEYIHRFKISKNSINYVIIFFILFAIIIKHVSFVAIVTIVPLCFGLVLALVLDAKFMIIPDTSCIAILIAGLLNVILDFSKEKILSSILGMFVGGLTLYVIDYIFVKITKKEGFGYGDMKLLGAIGFLFGLKSIVVIMIFSVIFSAIFSIGYIIKHRGKNINQIYLPFGPFIALSTFIICIIPATQIISSYIYVMDVLVNKMI